MNESRTMLDKIGSQHIERRQFMRYLFSLLLLAPAVVVAQNSQPAWKPDKPVELIISAAPGGANDRIGRSLQRVLQEGGDHFPPE